MDIYSLTNMQLNISYKNFIFASKAGVNASLVLLGPSPLSLEVDNSNNDDPDEKQSS